MLSCNLFSPHIPLYTRIYMCSLSSWTSASDILASCPTFHHSINPLSEEYLAILIWDVMWEVMERSWCHDWVTSPCFLQWQFLSLVVRRLWGMSAPAASHTPVINNININPLPALPPRDNKIIRANSSQIIFFSFWQNSWNLTQWTQHFSHLWSR